MSTSKFQTAMLWLRKEGGTSFGKLVKTLAQKRDKPEDSPAEAAVAESPTPAAPPAQLRTSIPTSLCAIQLTPELVDLKEAARTPRPAVAEVRAAPSPPPKSKPQPPPQPTPTGPAAVLTLDEHGRILAATEACEEVLGSACSSLAGQNIQTLLKGGLDNEVGAFLERHRAGKNPPGTTTLRATALRKDGAEFAALITAVNWGSDTAAFVKGTVGQLTWTAAIRNLAGKSKTKRTTAPVTKQKTAEVKLLPEHATPPKSEPSPQKAPKNTEKAITALESPKVIPVSEPAKITPAPEPPKATPAPESPKVFAASESPWEEPLVATGSRVVQPAAQPEAKTSDNSELTDELARIQKERDKTAEELQKVKAELVKRENEPPPQDPEATKRFEEQLTVLRQERDELTAKLSAEQSAAAEMKYRLDELEKHLNRFEQEGTALRQERDELHGKLTAEQLVAAELNYRLQELESRWGTSTSDLESVRADVANREHSEAEVRAELDTAKQAVFYMEAALKEEVARREKLSERLQNLSHSLKQEQAERSKRFEQEMIALRQERDDLNSKLASEQKDTAESTRRAQELESRLGKNAAEFDRAKADLEKQEAERERVEAEWREQLDAAHALRARLECSLTEARERNKRLEGEMLGLRGERNDLKGRMTVAEEALAESKQEADKLRTSLDLNATELEQLKATLEKQTSDEERTEAEWRKQLETAQGLHAKLEISLAELKERNKELEEELTEVRQERNTLKASLATEEESATSAGRKVKELQARIDDKTTELQQLKSLLAKNSAEHDRAEARWREQQASANALKKQLEADCAEAAERDARIRQELGNTREERDELKSKLKAERLAGEESNRRAEDLERRLERISAELDRAKTDLEKREAEMERAESKWREKLENVEGLAGKFEAAWTETAERIQRAELELADLHEERDHLRARLTGAARSSVGNGTKKRGGKSKPSKAPPPKKPFKLETHAPEADHDGTLHPLGNVAESPNSDLAQIHQYDFTPSNGHTAPKPKLTGKRRFKL